MLFSTIAYLLAANSPVTIISVLTALVLGSGTGGAIGGIIAWKRIKIEQKTAETQTTVGLKTVDVEQFKAMFPGGLGDAVEHWRDEARELYKEVDDLQEKRRVDHQEIMELNQKCAETKRELIETQQRLAKTERELVEAEARISQLELEAGHE